MYTVQTPGGSPTLYTGKGIQRQGWGGMGRIWGGRMILRDKRGWGGDKQGERKVYTEI